MENLRNGDRAMTVLRREMQIARRAMPESLHGRILYEDASFAMTNTEILFETPSAIRFHYRKGASLACERPERENPATSDELELYRWGTVLGAVAWINGFFPLHASAVSIGGRCVAFTAQSGGGKSTLAAALGQEGFEHVCDDTLVLANSDGEILAVPDGKRIKLWEDALNLARCDAAAPILTVRGKSYAEIANTAQRPLPFADLVFLEWGKTVELQEIAGTEKLALIPQAAYRLFVHLALKDHLRHADWMLQIASQVRFWRFTRPKNVCDFKASTDELARHFDGRT